MKGGPQQSTVLLVASQAFFNGALAVEVMWLGSWLEREALGLYFYALSLGSLLEVGIHWGAQHYLTREVADRLEQARRLLPPFLSLALLVLCAGIAVVTLLVDWPVGLIAGSVMVRSGAAMVGGMFIGRRDVLPPVIGRFSAQILRLVCLWAFVRSGPTLPVLSGLLFGVSSFYLLTQLICLSRIRFSLLRHNHPRRWLESWRYLGRQLLPFVLLFILNQFHYRADAILLKWLVGVEAVSVVMLGFKWIEGVFFIPAVVSTMAIPYLLEVKDQPQRLMRLVRRYVLALAAGLSGIAVVLLFAGPPLLEFAIGARFTPSLPYYYPLVWCIPLQGVGFFFSTCLVALQQEKKLLLLTGATAAFGLLAKLSALTLSLHDYVWALLASLMLHGAAAGTVLYGQIRDRRER